MESYTGLELVQKDLVKSGDLILCVKPSKFSRDLNLNKFYEVCDNGNYLCIYDTPLINFDMSKFINIRNKIYDIDDWV